MITFPPDPTSGLSPFYPVALRGFLDGKSLFYPCSGSDLMTPIRLFAPHVTCFWFVDIGYFSPGHQNTGFCGMDRPADQVDPTLASEPDYELLDEPPRVYRRGFVSIVRLLFHRHSSFRRKLPLLLGV